MLLLCTRLRGTSFSPPSMTETIDVNATDITRLEYLCEDLTYLKNSFVVRFFDAMYK